MTVEDPSTNTETSKKDLDIETHTDRQAEAESHSTALKAGMLSKGDVKTNGGAGDRKQDDASVNGSTSGSGDAVDEDVTMTFPQRVSTILPSILLQEWLQNHSLSNIGVPLLPFVHQVCDVQYLLPLLC